MKLPLPSFFVSVLLPSLSFPFSLSLWLVPPEIGHKPAGRDMAGGTEAAGAGDVGAQGVSA
jgi:hypothetical protein